jgi:hypothetical protein
MISRGAGEGPGLAAADGVGDATAPPRGAGVAAGWTDTGTGCGRPDVIAMLVVSFAFGIEGGQ